MSNLKSRAAYPAELAILNKMHGYADVTFQPVWLPDGLKWLPENSHVVLGTIDDDQADIVVVFTAESKEDAETLAEMLQERWAVTLWVEGGVGSYEPEADENEEEDETDE
jgi:hypothetical protein